MILSPKTGRPMKGETRKDLRLQLRLNQEEMALIDECAIEAQMTRTEVIMEGVRLVKQELDKKK